MFFAIAAKNQKSRPVFKNLKSTQHFAKAFKTRPSAKAYRTQTENAFFRSICSFSTIFSIRAIPELRSFYLVSRKKQTFISVSSSRWLSGAGMQWRCIENDWGENS